MQLLLYNTSSTHHTTTDIRKSFPNLRLYSNRGQGRAVASVQVGAISTVLLHASFPRRSKDGPRQELQRTPSIGLIGMVMERRLLAPLDLENDLRSRLLGRLNALQEGSRSLPELVLWHVVLCGLWRLSNEAAASFRRRLGSKYLR